MRRVTGDGRDAGAVLLGAVVFTGGAVWYVVVVRSGVGRRKSNRGRWLLANVRQDAKS